MRDMKQWMNQQKQQKAKSPLTEEGDEGGAPEAHDPNVWQ